MDEEMKKIIEKLDDLDRTIKALDRRVEDNQLYLDKKITDSELRLERKISDILLTLENETNRNIGILAEGHQDLPRKLDEALKVENEKEMLLIRVNILENELRRVKTRIDAIA